MMLVLDNGEVGTFTDLAANYKTRGAQVEIKFTYKCECGSLYSDGLHNSIIRRRKKKFEKCDCGRELREENNQIHGVETINCRNERDGGLIDYR